MREKISHDKEGIIFAPGYTGKNRRKNGDRRSGKERRGENSPNYEGPERRNGKDRRSGKDRRKSESKGYLF